MAAPTLTDRPVQSDEDKLSSEKVQGQFRKVTQKFDISCSKGIYICEAAQVCLTKEHMEWLGQSRELILLVHTGT